MNRTQRGYWLLFAATLFFRQCFSKPAPAQTVSFVPGYYAVGTNPASVAVGDFNGDGSADLRVATIGATRSRGAGNRMHLPAGR